MRNEEESGAGLPRNANSRNLLLLSFISASVYLFIAYLIFHYFHDSGIKPAFAHGFSTVNQLGIGVLSGGLGAGIIAFLMNRPPISEVLQDYYIVQVISEMRFKNFDTLQVSLFAGAGEELLFRGAIQPLLGIWVTSIIFVGLHGYFKFKTIGHLAFGAMMFGLSVGLGYLFEEAGLLAAMSAHAVYDIIMLKLVNGEVSAGR